MTDHMLSISDLTAAEFLSLRLLARGIPDLTIPRTHRARLADLGLIRFQAGKLLVTPNGRMVARG
jgi:hypothetical protein